MYIASLCLSAFICIEIPADKVSKAAIRGNLPPGYTFCNPEIGFASLKTPSTDRVHLLHCTEVEDSLQTLYVLSAVGLFSPNSPLELHFTFVKHHLEEGWYFADCAVVSNDATFAVQFLLDKPIYDRGPRPLEDMNRVVQRVVPQMLRKSGVSSIQLLIHVLKYKWLVRP